MKMNEVWTKKIGRFEYYILLSPVTARWMLCRRHDDTRDDDMVATGYAHRAVVDEVICDVRDELLEICKEITHD